jgi:hypothetical protein
VECRRRRATTLAVFRSQQLDFNDLGVNASTLANLGVPHSSDFSSRRAGNQILASYSVNKPGMNIGAGAAGGTKWHGKVFAEARWDRIFMSNFHVDYIPVTFGFRW